MKNLVIVESPAKAKTIGRYLGKDYIIEQGLSAGDTIIAEGAGLLKEGIEIRGKK